jgi:Cof subfamily protein (haloacid dehalogenase superfamily)
LISEENARAVQRLQAAGAQVVLASGRHYDSIRKYADALPGVQWIVSCQGGEVSDLSRTNVLSRKFLLGSEAEKTLAAGRSLGFSTVAYMVEGVFTESPWDGGLDFYTELAGLKPVKISRAELLKRDIFKVIWIGTAGGLTKAEKEMPATSLQVVRTNKRFLEFMPANVSKGNALEVLGLRLGIASADAVVFGDGDNDIPMFEWAGTSVAMAHSWPQALKKATCVAPNGAAETAFARAVDMVL